MQRTLSIIKPDATNRNITGLINSYLEERGLRIIAQKRISLVKERAEEFYNVHKNKPFFDELVNFMISGPVIVQVLEAKNAVSLNREVMGATNPSDAEEGTIRKKFGLSIQGNSVHGSDSLENAEKEINFFFKSNEIFV